MAEPFSHKQSGTLDDSTELDKKKIVKDFIRSPPSQIDLSQTKGISLLKHPKQGSKTDYSKKEFLHRPHYIPQRVGFSGKSALSISKISCKKLDLSGQGLTELPVVLSYYGELEELNLSNNPFSQDISFSESLRFPLLKKLNLSGCGLTELPKVLHSFYELKELNLSNNPLSHDISFFKYVRFPHGLEKLDLSGCGFTELPKDFHDFYTLEELNLSNNPLSHDISFFEHARFHELKKLDLSGCGLTGLPEDFHRFYKLEELNLSNNSLSYDMASLLENVRSPGLKKLDLSGCGLTDLPSDLEKCRNLQELNFSNNFFDHQDLLEKLNSGKIFSDSDCHQSCKELLEPSASGSELSKLTCRIIFEDAVYIRSSGVWTVEHSDFVSTPYVSSTKERAQKQIRNKEIWLHEFRYIRNLEKLTIEAYYSMHMPVDEGNQSSNGARLCSILVPRTRLTHTRSTDHDKGQRLREWIASELQIKI